MGTEEGRLKCELDGKTFNIFKDFMTRVTEIEELVSVGNRLLTGFQQALEFLRRPPIDKTSELVKSVLKANVSNRIQSYLEAGCINTHDGVQNTSNLHTCLLGLREHLSKGKIILNQLEFLLEDMTGVVQAATENLAPFWDEDSSDGNNKQETTDNTENALSHFKIPENTDYAMVMGIVYRMIEQDYCMQEKIVSALNFKTSSGELESYCLMWSLRPFINDEIMQQAWKLVP